MQGGVVMVQMTESAVVERQAFVTGPILRDIPVTVDTEIFGKGHAHRARHRRAMFPVAGDAASRIHHGQLGRITRIGEFLRWMGVIRDFELVTMAIDAGLLRDTAECGVAGAACQLDLVVAIAGFARYEQRCIFTEQDGYQVNEQPYGQQRPEAP